jgi:prolipoprotein diacylglyceryltransferase
METLALIIIVIILITIVMGLISIRNNSMLTKRQRVNYSILVILFPFWGTIIYYFLKTKR